jgi:hypothetical protein
MVFISGGSKSKSAKKKSGAGNSKKVGFWASQELAKQKAYEKKAKK